MTKKIIIKIAVLMLSSGVICAGDLENLRGTSELNPLNIEEINAAQINMEIPKARHHYVNTYFTEDCERIRFNHNDPLVSERVRLYSEQCTEVCGDEHGNHYPCHTTCDQSWRRTAQIEIMPRKIMPWETETFRVCLKGPEIRLHLKQPAYKYDVTRKGDYDVTYLLKPLDKIPTEPDENGLRVIDLVYDPSIKKFRMSVEDIWTKEYANEKVAIIFELRKHFPFWFDEGYGERALVFEVSPTYEFEVFPQNTATEIGKGEYFVKWGFKRIGKLSNDAFINKGDTFKVKVQ